jgi:glutamate-1-semialdehyde 2,1-aminomutase
VVHFGTFNASPTSAAAGIAVLRRVADGAAIASANAAAERLRSSWDAVLERLGIAGYVYGTASTYHVYFETSPERARPTKSRRDLHTTDAELLKGMPGRLISQYQLRMRFAGVDNMSSTGGVTCTAHSGADIEAATAAFEQTVRALRDDGLILSLA